MLVTTLATPLARRENKQGIVRLYKELGIIERPLDFVGKNGEVNFGIYDYEKKNKLTNNTGLE